MHNRPTNTGNAKKKLSGELLDFNDNLTAVNSGVAFVLQACAAVLQTGEPTNHRAAAGAVFCVELLNERTLVLEQQMADIRNRATGTGNSRRRTKKRRRSGRRD